MIDLQSSGLRVTLLDPRADLERCGSRYCVGGYIWQITDDVHGALLSGPQYPNPNPSPFDGQGIPEAFEIALGQDSAPVGEDVWVIGVGRVKRTSPVKPFHVRNNFVVTEFCPWDVHIELAVCTMVSRQKFQGWDFELTRQIRLSGRTVTSKTSLRNLNDTPVPLRWFAHPFFPHAGWPCTRFNVDCDLIRYLPLSGGFTIDSAGQISRSPEFDWKAGCFQLLNLPFGYPLEAFQKHPALGEVKVECRFPVAWMPIWANANTVSFEPYYHSALPSFGTAEWAMAYHF